MEGSSDRPPKPDERIDTLASFLKVDSDKLKDVDVTVLNQLTAKIDEFNLLKAENLKASVILDETKSSSDRKVDALKDHTEKLLAEIEGLRKEQTSFEDQRLKLADEKAAASNEARSLKLKIDELNQQKELCESSKLDIAKLLNEKINDLAASKQEADQLLADNKELRKTILDLENEIRTCKSIELRNKSDVQRWTQELSLVKSNNEWFEKELNAKTAEYNAYRQKASSELQAALNELSVVKNEFELNSSTSEALRKRNGELSKELQEKLITVKDLTDSLNTEKQEFTREMSLKQRLVELLEKQVQSLKNELDAQNKGSARAEEQVAGNDKIEQELLDSKKQLEEYEAKVIKLEATVQELLSSGDVSDSHNISLSVDSKSSVPKLYGDIGLLKKQLIHEKRQKELLQNQVEAFVIELEHKIPILNSFKERNEILERELTETALMLESVSKDKDDMKKSLDRFKMKVSSYEAQISSLIRQRSDLAHQVQYLLIQVEIKDDANGPLTSEENAFIKRIVMSDDNSMDSDSQKVISQRLLTFHNITELQSKNMELLDSMRTLADKLEKEELEKKSYTRKVENNAVQEAKEAILTLQEHNQTLENQIMVLAKERDAFRALSNEGSASSAENVVQLTSPESPVGGKRSMVEDLEVQLRTITEESNKNIKLLNDEIQTLYKSKAELSISFEKQTSARILAEERLKMAQKTLETMTQETHELKKRYRNLQDNILKQDDRTQKTIEKLINSESHVGQLEAEIRHLRAEKDFLRSVEKTLKEDNERLLGEKNGMSLLVAQLQTLQNEREKLLRDTQTSGQDKVRKLEAELSDTLSKLEKKTEEIDEYISSKDSQVQWFQDRINSLNNSVMESRSELDAKQKSIEHLESTIKILTSKLEESETRIQSYDVFNVTDDATSQAESLRKQIEKMSIQLKDAYSQLEEYKALASTNEDSLSAITKAYEDSKSASNKFIEDLTRERDMAKDKISILSDQVSNLNNELDHQNRLFEAQKSDLLKQLEILKAGEASRETIKSEYVQTIQKLQEDLNNQATYANTAQKNYEQELQKHADVSKTISLLREEAHKSKNEMISLKNAAESAHKILEQNEKSWAEQKMQYENQLSLVTQRTEDLSMQNRLLYEQLDLLTKGDHGELSNGSSYSNELVSTLRRERDILETKLEVAKRDERTYRQKLDFANTELEKTKIELMRLQKLGEASFDVSKSHEEVLEQLNQINLLRESNITLRNEAKSALEHNEQLQEKISELQSRLEPLESQIASLERITEEQKQQIALGKEEAGRWKQRSQDILHKYERIDPEEHRKLVEEVSELKAAVEKKTEQNSELEDRFQRLKKQARERLDASKAAQNLLSMELSEAKEKQKKLEEDLAIEEQKHKSLEAQLEEAKPDDGVDSSKLKTELQTTLEKLQHAEVQLQNVEATHYRVESDLKVQLEQVTTKLAELEKELEINRTSETSNASSKIVEQLKEEFNQEKEKLLAEREDELRKEFEEEKAKELKKLEDSLKQNPPKESEIDVGDLKREWEEEYEKQTLRRIEEANELLRKRIRLPTEERINKIIEARRSELENEFQSKVDERAKEIAGQKPPSGGFTEMMKNHKQEIEKIKVEMRNQFNEESAQIKKKAFDEGKQQASMKSMFLEKKIAKLEAQLKANDSQKEPQEPPTTTGTLFARPTKISEASPLESDGGSEVIEHPIMPIKTVSLEDSGQVSSEEKISEEDGSSTSKRVSEDNAEDLFAKKHKADHDT